MNNATLTGSAAFLLLVSTTLTAANHVFTGYFVDEQRTVAVEMEYFEGSYSGIMTDGADIFYELIARPDGARLVGQVIADGRPVPFIAENHGSFLVYTIDGVGYKFYRFEPDTGEAAQPSEQQAPGVIRDVGTLSKGTGSPHWCCITLTVVLITTI